MSIRHLQLTASLAMAVCLLTAPPARAQAPNATPPPPPSVKSGQAAPDFTANYLAMDNGRPGFKSVKLSDYKGQKNVVLAFFPAAFSPGCTNEMAKYQETSGQFNTNNTVILGMSVDSTWANAAFADKLGVKFNILSDASRDISKSLRRVRRARPRLAPHDVHHRLEGDRAEGVHGAGSARPGAFARGVRAAQRGQVGLVGRAGRVRSGRSGRSGRARPADQTHPTHPPLSVPPLLLLHDVELRGVGDGHDGHHAGLNRDRTRRDRRRPARCRPCSAKSPAGPSRGRLRRPCVISPPISDPASTSSRTRGSSTTARTAAASSCSPTSGIVSTEMRSPRMLCRSASRIAPIATWPTCAPPPMMTMRLP